MEKSQLFSNGIYNGPFALLLATGKLSKKLLRQLAKKFLIKEENGCLEINDRGSLEVGPKGFYFSAEKLKGAIDFTDVRIIYVNGNPLTMDNFPFSLKHT